MADDVFARTQALLGDAAFARLQSSQAIIVGVGGVGGWCAEALARSGVGRLVLIDDDVVAPSNLNRQCCALASTVGIPKVEAMKARLLAINPSLGVAALKMRWEADTTLDDILSTFSTSSLLSNGRGASVASIVIDAIDSVACKAQLILSVTAAKVPLLSSLGAAKRLDPTKVELKRFSKVEGDGLARALRQRFKKLGRFPSADFKCAVSTEPPAPIDTLGSMMPVTATFGLTLASAAIARLCDLGEK